MINDVFIIILNWNGWKDTIECLESVYAATYNDYHVIVVDNASTDDSIAKIKEYAHGNIKPESKFKLKTTNNKPISVFEVWEGEKLLNRDIYLNTPSNRRLILIKNKKNYGYAGGNNRGIEFVLKNFGESGYIYILNNDIIIEESNFYNLINVFNLKKDAGAVSPVQLYYYNPDTILSAGGSISISHGKTFFFEKGKKIYDLKRNIYEVPFVAGGAVIFKLKIFKEIGLFDECLFLYWDETDLLKRLLNTGYKIYINTSTKVWHKAGSSTRKINFYAIYFIRRNSIIFVKRYSKLSEGLLFSIIYLPYYVLKDSFSYIIVKRNLKPIYFMLRGVFDAFFKDPCDIFFLKKE